MTGSLADASFLKMILYIATTAVILAVFFALAWKIYLPAVLGMSETTSEKRILSKEEVTRTVKSNDPHLRDDRMEKTVPNPGLVHELCSDASHLAGLHAWHCPRFGHFQPWHG